MHHGATNPRRWPGEWETEYHYHKHRKQEKTAPQLRASPTRVTLMKRLGFDRGAGLLLAFSQRQQQAECCAPANFGFKVDGAVVQLQYTIAHGQADAAAGLFGREVEVENFVADVGRNASALVLYLDGCGAIVLFAGDVEHTAIAHGLHSVEYNVENGLLHQVCVGSDGQRVRQLGLELHTLTCGLG